MKNKLMIIGMIAFLIIASCITVYAGVHSVTLETQKTEIEVGETFTVKIKAVTPDGINGLVTTYSYDTQKLELVSKKVLDSNFTNLGGSTANEIALMFNPEDPSNFTEVTETNIYEFTFKVKEGVSVGSTAKITIGETDLNTLAQSSSEHKLPGDEITIKVVKTEEVQKPDDNTGGGTQKPDDNTGSGTQKPDDNTGSGTQKPDDDTVADGDINYAGLEDYALILVSGAIIIAIVLYKKTKKLRDI